MPQKSFTERVWLLLAYHVKVNQLDAKNANAVAEVFEHLTNVEVSADNKLIRVLSSSDGVDEYHPPSYKKEILSFDYFDEESEELRELVPILKQHENCRECIKWSTQK